MPDKRDEIIEAMKAAMFRYREGKFTTAEWENQVAEAALDAALEQWNTRPTPPQDGLGDELEQLMEKATPELTNGIASPKGIASLLKAGCEHQRPRADNWNKIDCDADAELIWKLVNNLPKILAALRSNPADGMGEAVSALSARIKAYLDKRGSLRELAREAGISPTTMMNARDGKCTTISPLLKIEAALGKLEKQDG